MYPRPCKFLLTQTFVSRKHMEIFGWYFPEEIINWYCDNWINAVYKPDHYFPLVEYHCGNEGGKERYFINESDKKNSFLSLGKNIGEQLKTKANE